MNLPNPKISSYLTERIAAGDFPSAVYLVAEGGSIHFLDALGDAVRVPEQIPATVDTIYDLASLTKPLVTGLLSAQAIERGELRLYDPVARFLPAFAGTDRAEMNIGQLLTHTSGLTPWLPLYVLADGDPARVMRAIIDSPLEYEPNTEVRYSDLGYITLGYILEQIAGTSLGELAQREIFIPLGLKDTGFRPVFTKRTRIAASETGNGFEREKAAGMGLGAAYLGWREDVIWGDVHDGNAHFMGGVAGHAGLFSTARETLILAQQFIARTTRLLRPMTCELFAVNLTPGDNEARSIGWQLAETRDSTAGPWLPPFTFGHLGFTGTSCWIDAEHERVYILLTNRTHDHPLPFVLINQVRRTFHTLAAQALGGVDPVDELDRVERADA
jgi:CubicO group peptidase (beta-lactamase class C family)